MAAVWPSTRPLTSFFMLPSTQPTPMSASQRRSSSTVDFRLLRLRVTRAFFLDMCCAYSTCHHLFLIFFICFVLSQPATIYFEDLFFLSALYFLNLQSSLSPLLHSAEPCSRFRNRNQNHAIESESKLKSKHAVLY